jgi:hypothetical protein
VIGGVGISVLLSSVVDSGVNSVILAMTGQGHRCDLSKF